MRTARTDARRSRIPRLVARLREVSRDLADILFNRSLFMLSSASVPYGDIAPSSSRRAGLPDQPRGVTNVLRSGFRRRNEGADGSVSCLACQVHNLSVSKRNRTELRSHLPRSRIFISYRRADAAGDAGRLADHLQRRFGAERLFLDVDTIEPGADFARVLREALQQT